MSKICVSIGRTRHQMVQLEHRALAERGAELAELRLDWLGKAPDLQRLLPDRPTPTIVTCRRQSDRGRWRGTEEQRQALLRAAIVAGVEYVDLEDDIAKSIRRYGKTQRIVSHHNFEETPDDLEERWATMRELDPDVIKIVTMANHASDIVRVLNLVAEADVPTVGFCMGELGMPSRILCGKYGSPFTYASFSDERELAPGQIPFEEMRNLYRFDRINKDTKVFGVLGDPIGHSMSPAIHNAAFRASKMNAVYIPFRVLKNEFAKTLKDFEWLDIKGYSVTIPHKEAAVSFAHHQDRATKDIGAANTLYRGPTGLWHAANTDYDAALTTLRLALGEDGNSDSLQGKKVLLLGAGGVARAIGLGMVRTGAGLTVSNRSHKRAIALAEQLECQQIAWENRGTVFADVLINCTPVGMFPNLDETPFEMHWLRDGMVVFDTIYNPENTLLLKQAREHACKTISGLEMFVRQAAVQFELFTGEAAPLDVMRETLRRAMSPLKMS